MTQEEIQKVKNAIRERIEENCEPNKEYGPYGDCIYWLNSSDVFQAIRETVIKGE